MITIIRYVVNQFHFIAEKESVVLFANIASLRITWLNIHALIDMTEETGHYFLKVKIQKISRDSLINCKQQETLNLNLLHLCILTRKNINTFTVTVHLSRFFLFNKAISNYFYP